MKTIVIDDDPTGSQTVHDCPLLLSWDKITLLKAIKEYSLLFILGNTRSLTPNLAEDRLREICKSVLLALEEADLLLEEIFFISRGDSTLRGHGVLEPKIINEELGPFDATFHIPAFFEGGRTTVKGTHFLNGIPVHRTKFAKDKIFGYSTSFIPNWIQEKSNNQIKSDKVICISIDTLNNAKRSEHGMNKLINHISTFKSNKTVVVDAKHPSDLDVFCKAVKACNLKKRFLFRSAASLINSLTNVKSSTDNIKDILCLRINDMDNKPKPGFIIVGSHVPLADEQINTLLKEENCIGIELLVSKILEILDGPFTENSLLDMETCLLKQLIDVINQNKTPILYTSRGEVSFESDLSRMKFGVFLAEFMARLTSRIIHKLGYIISKGGITTNTLLTNCLDVDFVLLEGQIMPGLSVVYAPKNISELSLPIITFPGNLGDQSSLLKAWRIMESNIL